MFIGLRFNSLGKTGPSQNRPQPIELPTEFPRLGRSRAWTSPSLGAVRAASRACRGRTAAQPVRPPARGAGVPHRPRRAARAARRAGDRRAPATTLDKGHGRAPEPRNPTPRPPIRAENRSTTARAASPCHTRRSPPRRLRTPCPLLDGPARQKFSIDFPTCFL